MLNNFEQSQFAILKWCSPKLRKVSVRENFRNNKVVYENCPIKIFHETFVIKSITVIIIILEYTDAR